MALENWGQSFTNTSGMLEPIKSHKWNFLELLLDQESIRQVFGA